MNSNVKNVTSQYIVTTCSGQVACAHSRRRHITEVKIPIYLRVSRWISDTMPHLRINDADRNVHDIISHTVLASVWDDPLACGKHRGVDG